MSCIKIIQNIYMFIKGHHAKHRESSCKETLSITVTILNGSLYKTFWSKFIQASYVSHTRTFFFVAERLNQTYSYT